MHHEDSAPARSAAPPRRANPRLSGNPLPRPAEPPATAERGPEGPRPLLDLRTQLVDRAGEPEQTSGWKFTYWPECGEASLVVVTSGSTRSPGKSAEPKTDEQVQFLWDLANGRAGSRSRRYFVANRLRYMWVLTFAEGRYDRRGVMSEVGDFARRLRAVHGGEPYPYWYSPELHPGGHGWHVNFFIPFRVPHAQVESLWGQGFVWVTDFASAMVGPQGEPLGLCRTPRESLRRAAHYGCKYSQKDWSPEHVGPQNHRYEVAQGFSPVKQDGWVRDPEHAKELVAGLVSAEDRRFLLHWDSNDEVEWLRPPVQTWRW